MQSSADLRRWSGPQLTMQPDFDDEELIEIYGMPVFPYGDGYVGLPWIFHSQSSEPARSFNRFVGSIDCGLALSRDGIRFERASRKPFLSCGDPDAPTSGAIEPSCLVESENEIRIYSSASRVQHGRGAEARRHNIQSASITLHTLRKDGLTFLESVAGLGRWVSRPIVLLDSKLNVNVSAPHGEVRFQMTDLESRPVQGFTFEDGKTLSAIDDTSADLQWRNKLDSIVGKVVRLECAMQHARLYAIRGKFHFLDAQDRLLLDDGHAIEPIESRSIERSSS